MKAMACQLLQSEILAPAPWFSSNPANTGKVSNAECINVVVFAKPNIGLLVVGNTFNLNSTLRYEMA